MTKQRGPISGRRVIQGGLAAALCLGAPAAHAADCSTLTNPVYVAGSSAVKPFVAQLAAALKQQSTPINIVYQGQGSCIGAGYFGTSGANTISGKGVTFQNDATDDPAGCDLDALGTVVDIGVSDVWADTCGVTLDAGVTDAHGPVQAMTFVVPTQSSQTAISYEAAYLVFAKGDAGAVAPWTDHTVFEVRAPSSGTLMMIASVIQAPGNAWQGNAQANSGAVVTALAADVTANKAENAIGILSADVADKNRSALKILAYQHKGQTKGYFPDSSAQTFDKRNVRDGHYMTWGPLHMFTKAATGNAKTVIDYLSGAVEPPAGLDLVKVEAKASVVPDCAMMVKREADGGAMSCYAPPKMCGCKFETEATGTKPASCTACTDNTGCSGSTPKCNYGFCEVQ